MRPRRTGKGLQLPGLPRVSFHFYRNIDSGFGGPLDQQGYATRMVSYQNTSNALMGTYLLAATMVCRRGP